MSIVVNSDIMFGFKYIYTLNCPITGNVRYVGQSVSPNARIFQHITKSICNKGTHLETRLNKWICGLQDLGMFPQMHIINIVKTDLAGDFERFYIYTLSQVYDLLNSEKSISMISKRLNSYNV